jgi:hypothetical protein
MEKKKEEEEEETEKRKARGKGEIRKFWRTTLILTTIKRVERGCGGGK